MQQNWLTLLQNGLKKLENHLEEIELGFYDGYQNEQIVQSLKQCLETMNDVEQRTVINSMSEKYVNNTYFAQLYAKYQLNPPQQGDFTEQYEQLKQNQDQRRLMSLFQQDNFWQLGLLPQQIKPIIKILEALDSKIFFYVIEIAEISINRIQQVSQFLMLKRLLEIKYNHDLQKDYQILLEQTIGSMLINQIYELENFIQTMKQSDSSEFQKTIMTIQRKQKHPNQQILLQNQFQTLFELFTPQLEKENLSQNLDSYIKQTLSIVSDNLYFEQLQTEFEEFIRKDGNFYEFYFKVIIYFWGQFCDYFLQNKNLIMKRLDNKDKLMNVFWNNKLGKSQIPSYFFDRFLFFIEPPSFQMNELTQFEQRQEEIKQKIQITFAKGSPSGIDLRDIDLWSEVQQLTYSSLNQMKIENYHAKILLKVLWMNMKLKLNNQSFVLLFFNQEKCIFSYDQYLVNIQILQSNLKFDLLTLQLIKIYFQPNDPKQNSLWQQPLNYFRIYKFSQLLLERKQLIMEYPQQMNINLENFNISLSETNSDQRNQVIDKWVKQTNDEESFRKLIPFYFNIIKRGESSKYFTTSISESFSRLQIESKFLNLKAVFQIFYNNSNEELKMMLIKLHSKYNPVPLIYQNFYFDQINSELDLFTFNHNLFYVFPNCYPIINLSLSKKQSKYGKTTLINDIFYSSKKFEVKDICQLNNNTIDIMFDFQFDERKLAVADVHGIIPNEILIKILPLFFLWIIQINSEDELEENKKALRNILNNINNIDPILCLIIRNSKLCGAQNQEEIHQLEQNQQINILRIQDWNQQNIDQQTIHRQIKKTQEFLFSKIYRYDQSQEKYIIKESQQLKKRKNLAGLSQQLYSLNKIQYIHSDTQSMKELKKELKHLFSLEKGFFNIKAFPIRSIECEVKQKEIEIFKLGVQERYNRPKYNDLTNQITLLKKELCNSKPSKLLNLFMKTLKTENYYISYLSFTATVQMFNSIRCKQLQKNSDEIAKEIQKQKSQNNGDQQKIMDLEQSLRNTAHEIYIKSINIENFWRELIKQTQYNKNETLNLNVVRIVYELIKKGEPCEFLDGDDLKINKEFIQQLAEEFNQNNERVLILSALGPQSSGKSTVLNRIFGCHFLTSVGKTTKGINLQLLNVRNKEVFENSFDYILLLDTEGLQSPNQQDPEFDQKISLLVLAVSDIIFLIVKGDIHRTVKNLIETCIYTLSQIKESFSSYKQLIWCFNQNNDVNDIQPFQEQLQDIIANVKKVHFEENIDFTKILSNENIQILGFAQVSQTLCNSWNQYKNIDTFSQIALQICVEILKKFSNRLQEEKGSLLGIKNFVKEINNIWESIQKMPDLLEFTELIEKQQNKIMHDEMEIIWKDEKQKLENNIHLEVDLKQQIKDWGKKPQNFTYQEFYEQSIIAQKIKNTKSNLKERLQEIKEKNSISIKVFQKYEAQLDRLINQEIMEYQFLIIEEIENHKIENQKLLVHEKINNYIQNLSENQREEFFTGSQKIDEAYIQLLEGMNLQQEITFEPLYNDFEQNLIQMLKIEKNDCVLAYDFTKNFDFFKTKLNRNEPNASEKSEIYNNLQKEQVESLNGFMAIPKDNKYFQFIDIFFKDLQEKIILQNQQAPLVRLNDCFDLCKKYVLVEKKEIQPYINNSLLEDLITLIANQRIQYQDMFNFFSILTLFKIEYKQTQLENLIYQISAGQKEVNMREKILNIGESFIQGLKYQQEQKIVLQNEFFVNNFALYYRSLKYTIANFNSFYSLDSDQFAKFISEKHQNNVIVINESLLKPKIQGVEDQISFTYIISPLKNQMLCKQFRESFPAIFNNIMIENENGWKLLFSQVYDLIISSFNSDQMLASQENSNKIQKFDQIKNIMQQVEDKIKMFNQQFAFFGVILRSIGERYIKNSSLLILWRFFCLSKSRRLRMLQPQQDFKVYFQQLFKAKIERNKLEQSNIQARAQSKRFIQVFETNYYRIKRQQVIQFLESKMISSYEIIKQLDKLLLIDYTKSYDNIIQYLCDHKTYLNEYIQKILDQIKQDLLTDHQSSFNKLIKQNFEYILMNIDLLLTELPELKNVQDYFQNQMIHDEQIYENKLYDIILNSLQGNRSLFLDQLNGKYQKVFLETQFQHVQIPFDKNQIGPNVSISQLFPFLQELRKQCLTYSSQQKIALLNLQHFEIDVQIQNLLNEMKGCQEVCPLCGRKCDQSNILYIEHKHACRNGHQIRGINKVILQGKPSLFTCEEIQDEDVIIIQNTNILIKWGELKKKNSDWDFNIYDSNEYQENFKKMLNVWNGQIGKQLCQKFDYHYESKQLEWRKYQYEDENIHYIIVIEDSSWINEDKWDDLQLSTLEIMKKIQQSMYSKLSVILFNSEARVAIDCDDVHYPFKQLVRNKFPQANIELAFETILQQFQNHRNKFFEKVIIIVHTKGLMSFPNDQIQALCSFPANEKQQIIFRFYSLAEVDFELDKIVETFRKSKFDVEQYQFQNPEFVKELWAEKISSSKIFKF